MAEVGAMQIKTPQITQRLRAVALCAIVGLAASIVNVYLQFVLNEFFITGSLLFIRMYEDGIDELFASSLYFVCGLLNFSVFLILCRPFYKALPLNMVAAILVISYGYSAFFWFSHWHLGFDHWHHIAIMQVPFIVASTIYPICMAALFLLTLLAAKIVQTKTKAGVTQLQMFSRRDGLTLLVLTTISLLIWFGLYGTVAPYFGPASAF